MPPTAATHPFWLINREDVMKWKVAWTNQISLTKSFTISKDILGSLGTVQQEKKPRFDANTGMDTLFSFDQENVAHEVASHQWVKVS